MRFRARRVVVVVLAASAFAGCAGHEEALVDPQPSTAAAWLSFQAQRPNARALRWNARRDTPRSVWGVLSSAKATVDESAARAFLTKHAALLRLPRPQADLVLERAQRSDIGRHYRFVQRHHGLTVEDAGAAVHFDRSGRVVALYNNYHPAIVLPTLKPGITKTTAIERAAAMVPLDPRAEADLPDPAGATLVVFPTGGHAVLAWRVTIPTLGPNWLVYLDAKSGTLLEEPRDTNRYVTGKGYVFKVNAIVALEDPSLEDNRDAASAVPAAAYMEVDLVRLVGNGFLDGEWASSSKTKKRKSDPSHLFYFDRSSHGFSEVMGYYYLTEAQGYIQTVLGFNDVNNRRQVFAVNRYHGDNSFYSPSTTEISYGLGGVDDAEDADVIWHEYGHSIQDDVVPGFGKGDEAGAMGEGFGDYFAGTMGAQLTTWEQECIAEWDATSYDTDPLPCLRRLDADKHYPESVTGSIHADGEIWSGALWKIRGALGNVKADRAILQHHYTLAIDATFNEAATAILLAATNQGLSQTELDTIRGILETRGFTIASF